MWVPVLSGVLLLLGHAACQGGDTGFACEVNADCPPECTCEDAELSGTCQVTEDSSVGMGAEWICEGDCNSRTGCPDGTSCQRVRLEERPVNMESVGTYSCLPLEGTGGTGGIGGTGGTGGTAGTGGTGGSFSATIVGQVVDADDTTGLDAVFVRAILGSVGIGSDMTEGGGMFSIPVSEQGTYRLCAIGAILSPPRFVSTNCEEEDDQVPVPPSDAVTLSITTGYYMELDPSCGQCSFMQAAGTNIDLRFDYQVWNRSGVLQTTTYIVVGIDEKAQGSHLVGDAGSFRLPTEDATGTASFALTATQGTIYARLLPLGSVEDAEGAYEDGFDAARETNYVVIGTVTTTP